VYDGGRLVGRVIGVTLRLLSIGSRRAGLFNALTAVSVLVLALVLSPGQAAAFTTGASSAESFTSTAVGAFAVVRFNSLSGNQVNAPGAIAIGTDGMMVTALAVFWVPQRPRRHSGWTNSSERLEHRCPRDADTSWRGTGPQVRAEHWALLAPGA